ncbi:MAG: class I SAM-dependent methyltransferase [Patescibacteria group bacterium]
MDSLLVPKGKIFDATMGRGRHIIYFAKKGYDVIGNDYNSYMVELVKKDLRKNNLKASLYNLDVTDLSEIKDNSFDYVICMYSSLGCIPGSENRQKAVNEFSRIVKKGGLVVIHAHNRLANIGYLQYFGWTLKTYFWREKDLEVGDNYLGDHYLGGSYIHIFSHGEIKKIFRLSGLKITEEVYLNKNQNGYYSGWFNNLRSGGFIFVGQK